MLIHQQIHMHVATSGTLAAMKFRALELVNKLKILPVF
jgi:hypothetical protein